MDFMENGYYYRLSAADFNALSEALAGTDFASVLSDFQKGNDGNYYALCDLVDFGEQGAIIEAGYDLDIWIYVNSNQWIHYDG